jgi:pyridinium-3,5-biscarboxylic acid mononucleotide synthase
MDPARVRALLERVKDDLVGVEEALEELRTLPFRQLGDTATIDHHRALRVGIPEIVLGEGKTAEQIILIVEELARAGGNVLATRVDPAKAEAVRARVPAARYEAEARALFIEQKPWEDVGRGTIAIVSAGTSDRPVAEEAAFTAHVFGHRIDRIYDVGVAGVHRTLARIDALRAAEVLIVVAGMEGALPSLIAGLVERPVIAVPTSIGYGASFGGLAALLAMMTSCAAGVTVVNIDNGFGAAYAAALVNRR